MAKWIRFQFLTETGKTKVWEVMTIGDYPTTLGSVKWHGPWRGYAFFPEQNTVYEKDCLRDLAEFCEAQTREHRKRK